MLTVANLVKRFGGLTAVNDLSFSVPDNSVLGLIGVNGSGKTTVLNCISGLYTPDGGRVTWNGDDITGASPHDVTRVGVGRTFQVPRVFPRLTLLENVTVPALNSPESNRDIRARAMACLDRVTLGDKADNFGEELSGGQQKLLELARIMMFSPKLVLLDEPFAGVNPALCNVILKLLQAMLADGTSFILVSHDMTSVYSLSDNIMVLNEGAAIAEGDVAHIKSHPEVIEAYLGGGA